jgi:hypothetical protein
VLAALGIPARGRDVTDASQSAGFAPEATALGRKGLTMAKTTEPLPEPARDQLKIRIAGEWSVPDFQVLLASVAMLAATFEVVRSPGGTPNEVAEALTRIRRCAASTGRALAQTAEQIRVVSIRYSSPGIITFEGLGDIIRAVGDLIERMVLLRQRQLQERARTEQERAKTDQARADAEHSRRMRDAEYVRALIEALREMHEALVQMGFSEDEARREVGNVIRALAPVTGLAEAKKILPARTPAA